MKKSKRDNPSPDSRKPGRPAKPAGSTRDVRAICYLLTTERPIVERAAHVRGLSVSDTLRAGLRSLGVDLTDQAYRIPARD